MKLSIIGQDTLASAACECCRKHFDLVEPEQADLVWICYDTPIVNDAPVPEWVLEHIAQDVKRVKEGTLILFSSQMPVGTTAFLEKEFPNHVFAHSPENIRVATSIADFENQARVVVGVRQGKHTNRHHELLWELFSPFTKTIILTNPETAEMCKHTLNCWLGMNIAFINEIARLSSVVGANVDVITQSLRLERRISPSAPLKAGPPFGGGHLARDIHVISSLADKYKLSMPIICSIKKSNQNVV